MRHLLCLIFVLCIIGFAAGQDSPAETPPDPTPESTQPQMPPRPKVAVEFTPVEKVLVNTPIRIGIRIVATREGDQVFLHFREAGRLDFNSTPMGYNPMTKQYETEIDERFHGKDKVEYYIEVFPIGAPKIRLPENVEAVYSVETYTSFNDVMRIVLICIIIPSPIFIAYLVSRLRKAHLKRTNAYQQKLKSRERQLTRQREKHYQEYVRKMTGGKSAAPRGDSKQPPQPAGNASPGRSRAPEPAKTAPVEVKATIDSSEMILEDTDHTADALKRELDEILSAKSPETPQPQAPSRRLTPPPSAVPPRQEGPRLRPAPPRQTASGTSPQQASSVSTPRQAAQGTSPSPQQKQAVPPTRPAARPAGSPGQPPARTQEPTSVPRPEPKPPVKPVSKPELKPPVKPVSRPEQKPPVKPVPKPPQKPPIQPPSTKPEPKPPVKPAPRPAVTPVEKPSAKPVEKPAENKPRTQADKKKPDARTEREKLLDLLGLDDL